MSLDVAVILIVGAMIISAIVISHKIGQLSRLNDKPTGSKPIDDAPKTQVSALNSDVSQESSNGAVHGKVVAAITAAIFAMGEADGVVYKINDIKPAGISGNNIPEGKSAYKRPVWMQAGINDNTRQF